MAVRATTPKHRVPGTRWTLYVRPETKAAFKGTEAAAILNAAAKRKAAAG